MNYIPIKKETRIVDGVEQIVYLIPALTIGTQNGNSKKVPHPIGKDCIVVYSEQEAQDLIERAGYDYNLPSKKIPVKAAYTGDYSSLIFDSLTELAKDMLPNVAASAITALGEIGNVKSLDLFIDKSGEENELIRAAAVEAIGKLGHCALKSLIQTLSDKNWVRRNSAIIALGNIAKCPQTDIEKAILPLADCLKDNNSIVRATAAQTMGIIYKILKERNTQPLK